MSTATSTEPTAPRTMRGHPATRRLWLAFVFVAIGSVLPWLYTAMQAVLGSGGPGLWTFCAAMIVLGGLMLGKPRVAGWMALLMAVAGIVLPSWQVIHMVGLVGFSGWYPGPGLVLVFAGGVLAALAGRDLLR